MTLPFYMIIQSAYSNPELSQRRLEISRHTSIVGLRTQQYKPIVHLALSNQDPYAQERLEAYQSTGCEIKPLYRDKWNLYKEEWEIPAGRKVVGRLDDDDVIPIDFCQRTVAAAPTTGNHAMLWPTGYVFWRQQIFKLTHVGNQFVALLTDNDHNPHQEQHWQYHKLWHHINVTNACGWIWVRHGDAATSTLPRYRRQQVPRIDASRFHVNLRAILRACEASGTPSGDYTEHGNRQTLRYVLKENRANAPRSL